MTNGVDGTVHVRHRSQTCCTRTVHYVFRGIHSIPDKLGFYAEFQTISGQCSVY